MSNVYLLYPMAAMVLLITGVALVMLRRRFAAARNREVAVDDFRIYNFGPTAPEKMIAAGRNFGNLFEVPVVFYTVCLATMVLGFTDWPMVIMAWVYVASRVVHSVVHVTSNTVLVRMRVFALSCLVMVAMWIWLVLRASGLS